MGQNFYLVAPRAQRALPWGGKLGEILFDGSAEVLVRLLAVPVRPNTASEAVTCDAPKAIDTGKSTKRKVEPEVLDDSRAVKQAKTGSSKSKTDTHRSATFSNLPCEVHQLIFDHIEYIEDVICLGVTNRYFWALSRQHFHDHYASSRGLWAGENIVCVGENVEPGDYPPGLFSEEELDELRERTTDIPPYDEYNPDEVAHPAEPFTLYHFTFPSISDMDKDIDAKSESYRTLLNCRGRGSQEDPVFRQKWGDLVFEESTYFPQDEPWILRNLTTKEFVRSEAIALKPEYIHGPNIDLLGFGEVIMSRISWSSSSSISMNDPCNISRGVWAGHRFDITTLAKHRHEDKVREWTDASEEVANEIASIWESDYGPDWREEVCSRWHNRWIWY
ncbi:hypothetical protein TrVFT333_001691 [Trichoderma virens FT-333]|nr:hypothetical protein TrVFT333_001691 [Trichoderma virens FT-333]